jgi:hypothetical protein
LKANKHDEASVTAKALSDGLKELDINITDASEKLSVIRANHSEVQSIQSDISSNQRLIGNLQAQITDLQRENDVTDELTDTAAAALELDTRKTHYSDTLDSKSKHLETRSYYDAIGELLKDTGIKTKIIRQYLPLMNNLITKYLNILDFFVKFDLDESFNETIRSRHRDEFSYASFSEGEKSRIDLALLFAWRHIAKLKNSTNTNLLILDETFDSSLDVDGVDNLLKILYSLKKDSNVFIISHKKDVLDGKFPRKIEFEKVNNFSQVKKDG